MFSQLLKLIYPLLDGLGRGRAPNGSSRLGWYILVFPAFIAAEWALLGGAAFKL